MSVFDPLKWLRSVLLENETRRIAPNGVMRRAIICAGNSFQIP